MNTVMNLFLRTFCVLLMLFTFSVTTVAQEQPFSPDNEISIPAEPSPEIDSGEHDPFDNLVTLNLKDASVTDVFRLIAEQNNLNIIVSPNINSKVSLRLADVTLREAMDVILQSASARMEQTDNIIRIYSLSEKDKGALYDGRLITKIIDCNYVNARQIVAVLNDLKSSQGKIKIFDGTSSSGTTYEKKKLIITDFPENLEAILELHKRLDVETRQIMISAKIIETTLTDAEIMGTDWTIGASLNGPPFELDSKYAANNGKIAYGTLNLGAFKAVYERVLANQDSNVLSDAKLVVLDGEQAHIHVGDVIPVDVNTIASGISGTTNFGRTSVQQWEVGVTLDVTPHMLEADVIRMDVSPDVSSVTGSQSGSGNAPTTNSRSVDTKILIRSGETIVIGGLVQDMESISQKKVPVLGDLPLIGSMFRKKSTTKNKLNLIIFITGTLLDLKGDQSIMRSQSAEEIMSTKDEPSVDEFLEYK